MSWMTQLRLLAPANLFTLSKLLNAQKHVPIQRKFTKTLWTSSRKFQTHNNQALNNSYFWSSVIITGALGSVGMICLFGKQKVACRSRKREKEGSATQPGDSEIDRTLHSPAKISSTEYEGKATKKNKTLNDVIDESRDLLQRIKDEVGSPGLVVAVSVDGKEVWTEGLGYADVENRVLCHKDTVMRIASISKSIAMAAVAKLWEAGKLDLDKPVQHYVPDWPKKTFDGDEVTITTRQLVSHLGGIRHYEKSCGKDKKKNKETAKEGTEKSSNIQSQNEGNQDKDKKVESEFDLAEYHLKTYYKNLAASLSLFKEDQLCSRPGTEFLYTTHGWTLISAVVEGASGQKFPKLLNGLFKDLGLERTYLDENEPLIYGRARYYMKNKKGRVVNAPYVDCSYKWAGGGLVSTVQDLVKFGNAMLYSYQYHPGIDSSSDATLPGYLKPRTMQKMWSPVTNTKCSWIQDGAYGMGWGLSPAKVSHGHCREQKFYVAHTGGAIGASSVLLVMPRQSPEASQGSRPSVQGVVVAVIVNMQSVGLSRTAFEVAKKFEQVSV